MEPTPVLLPGEFHEQRSLVGYSPWDRRVGHNCATIFSSVTSLWISLSYLLIRCLHLYKIIFTLFIHVLWFSYRFCDFLLRFLFIANVKQYHLLLFS